MDIQIITTSIGEDRLHSSKSFGIMLNKILSEIKMLHWFVQDYNLHVIYGNLYDEVSDLFDELQEEIIGTSRFQGGLIPNFQENIAIKPWDSPEFYGDDETIIEAFNSLTKTITGILTSMEFESYIKELKSGIINTRDAILTQINKAEYLANMK